MSVKLSEFIRSCENFSAADRQEHLGKNQTGGADCRDRLSKSARLNKGAIQILGATAAVAFALGGGAARSSELGYPASALAEFSQPKPLLETASAPHLAGDEEAPKSDKKTIKYTGKCYAKLDGRVRINGPCPVTWKTGEEVSVDLVANDVKNESGAVWRAGVFRDGRKWYAHWGRSLEESSTDAPPGGEAHASQQDLGEVKKHGSCWSNSRVRICERET